MRRIFTVSLSCLFFITAGYGTIGSSDYSSFPASMETLLGKHINHAGFDAIKARLGHPKQDESGQWIMKDQNVSFIFRKADKTLWQIRMDLLFYDGPVPLGLRRGMNFREMNHILNPEQVLKYSKGSYLIGERYSVLASFSKWPRRSLETIVVMKEEEEIKKDL